MTVTAIAVAVAALATIGVMTGVIPDRGNPSTAPSGAAAAAFATRLATDRFAAGSSLYTPQTAVRVCEDCATVESVHQHASSSLEGGKERIADQWEVRVRMDDGTMLTVAAESQPSWHAGERVRLVDGTVMSM
jgi:hypothetical protein